MRSANRRSRALTALPEIKQEKEEWTTGEWDTSDTDYDQTWKAIIPPPSAGTGEGEMIGSQINYIELKYRLKITKNSSDNNPNTMCRFIVLWVKNSAEIPSNTVLFESTSDRWSPFRKGTFDCYQIKTLVDKKFMLNDDSTKSAITKMMIKKIKFRKPYIYNKTQEIGKFYACLWTNSTTDYGPEVTGTVYSKFTDV